MAVPFVLFNFLNTMATKVETKTVFKPADPRGDHIVSIWQKIDGFIFSVTYGSRFMEISDGQLESQFYSTLDQAFEAAKQLILSSFE